MTRDEAVRRAREALGAWSGAVDVKDYPAHLRLADALRDLLAVEVEPSEAVKRCKEAAKAVPEGQYIKKWQDVLDAIDALPDTLAPVLTEEEREKVEYCRSQCGGTYAASTSPALLAIIDRLCPKPEPKHKPCPFCGDDGHVRDDKGVKSILCYGCGSVVNPGTFVVDTAWAAWDRRAPLDGGGSHDAK